MGKASWRLSEGDELVPGRTVLRRLGGGERYEVYLVADDHLWTSVVAKVLRPDRADRATSRRAMEREADVLRAVAHPNIVRMFAADTSGDRPHIVLEHLEGPTLGRLIRRFGPITIEQAIPLAITAGAALQYLHNEGWVHLDVKPDNVVMGIAATIVDLSAARRVGADAPPIAAGVGTPPYMSPEQIDPERFGAVGPPADVWGLGSTLYRALAGSRPFPSAQGDRPAPQMTEPPRPMPERVPRVVAELVEACLIRDQGSRPTAGEVAASFEPLIAAMPSRPTLRRRRPRLA